jgi:hypothetical protein
MDRRITKRGEANADDDEDFCGGSERLESRNELA